MPSSNGGFENYVNYAGSKTINSILITHVLFENYVNYAGSKTSVNRSLIGTMFENYVNYAGSKTRRFANSVNE